MVAATRACPPAGAQERSDSGVSRLRPGIGRTRSAGARRRPRRLAERPRAGGRVLHALRCAGGRALGPRLHEGSAQGLPAPRPEGSRPTRGPAVAPLPVGSGLSERRRRHADSPVRLFGGRAVRPPLCDGPSAIASYEPSWPLRAGIRFPIARCGIRTAFARAARSKASASARRSFLRSRSKSSSGTATSGRSICAPTAGSTRSRAPTGSSGPVAGWPPCARQRPPYDVRPKVTLTEVAGVDHSFKEFCERGALVELRRSVAVRPPAGEIGIDSSDRSRTVGSCRGRDRRRRRECLMVRSRQAATP